jgi:hypothetical protein
MLNDFNAMPETVGGESEELGEYYNGLRYGKLNAVR